MGNNIRCMRAGCQWRKARPLKRIGRVGISYVVAIAEEFHPAYGRGRICYRGCKIDERTVGHRLACLGAGQHNGCSRIRGYCYIRWSRPSGVAFRVCGHSIEHMKPRHDGRPHETVGFLRGSNRGDWVDSIIKAHAGDPVSKVLRNDRERCRQIVGGNLIGNDNRHSGVCSGGQWWIRAGNNVKAAPE